MARRPGRDSPEGAEPYTTYPGSSPPGYTAAHERGAVVIADAVTSLGGHPFEMAKWDVDACYSCSQKCIGAPPGLAPVAFAPSALERRVPCRSFYFDLGLHAVLLLRPVGGGVSGDGEGPEDPR